MASPIDPHQAIAQGLAALQARDPAKAVTLLREASRAVPTAEMPWLALGNAELALGNLDAAEVAIDNELQLHSREVGALLIKGLLRERQGDSRGAASFYQMAANQAAVNGGTPPALADLLAHGQRFIASAQDDYAAHLTEVLGDALSPAMREAIDLLTGRSEIYLQQPSVFYYPGLPQKRFYDPADFPWLEPMLALVSQMQDELAAALSGSEAFEPYVTARPDRPAPNNPLLNDMAWSAHYFWRDGAVVEDHAQRCLATMAALSYAPMPRIPARAPSALWSRLRPGAHITPHHGMLNTRLICHIPILTAPRCTFRVGNETREWVDGIPFIFDDSVEHEARNAGPQSRVVLLFEIWRPEVGEEDREAITRIFQAIDSFGIN